MAFLVPYIAKKMVAKSGIKPSLSNPLHGATNAVQKLAMNPAINPANALPKVTNALPKVTNVPVANALPKVTNALQKVAGVPVTNAPVANALQKVAGVPVNAPANAVQKLAGVPNEAPVSRAEDKSWEVTLVRIYTVMIQTLFALMALTWNTIYWLIKTFRNTLFRLLRFIASFIAYMFIPCSVFVILYFTLGSFWDGGVKPMMEVIMMGINGMVDIWNSVVRGLRSFGIPIDTASGFGQGFPTFWEFIKSIFIMVGKLIESSFKGIIFR